MYKIKFPNRLRMWAFIDEYIKKNYKANNYTFIVETDNFSVLSEIHGYDGELL